MGITRVRDGAVGRHVRSLFGTGAVGTLTDAELLARYTARGDAGAFEALVTRHGPMVLRVCRDLLDDPHAAQDAFQATFLVLLRRAGSIREGASLGSWLHGVARRVASKARVGEARRRRRERRAVASGRAEAFEPDPGRALDLAGLHAEIDRLPASHRAPVVLCYLEGLTHDQAAARLGWPVGTVRGRLARARDRLRDRLRRRGLSPAVSLWLRPPELSDSLVRSVVRVGIASRGAPGVVPAAVAALVEGASRMLIRDTTRRMVAGAAALGMLAVGGAWVAYPGGGGDEGRARNLAPTAAGGVAPGARMETRVYAVADLIGTPADGVGAAEAEPVRSAPDFAPLIELIRESVSPGTWSDGEGPTVEGAKGSITPFFLNTSLIVRHTPEVHGQVVQRLRQVRRLRGLRDPSPELVAVAGEVERRLGIPAAPAPAVPRELSGPKLDAEAYLIEPPDLLFIEVTGAPDDRPIRGERLVRPDGTISLGSYGDVYVSGLTLREAKEKVILALRRSLTDEQLGLVEGGEAVEPARSAKVTVDVAGYNSKNYRVVGAVRSPGKLPLTGSETVLDALNSAGGLDDGGAALRVQVVRDAAAGRRLRQVLPVDLEAIVGRGDAATNYRLRPHDWVVVSERDRPLDLDALLAAETAPRRAGEPGGATATSGGDLGRRLDEQGRRLREMEGKLDRLLRALERADGPGSE